MIRTTLWHTSLMVAALTTAVSAAGSTAQDVEYRSVTRIDMGTALNVALKLAGASEFEETTYLKGGRMRTDTDETSVIYDVEGGRYIFLNHKERTYTSVTLDRLAEVPAALITSVEATPAGGRAQAVVENEEGRADFDFDLKVEPTSERQSINGQDAQRLFITMETDIEVTPEGETRSEDVGKLVLLMDMWNSNAGPAYVAVQAFQQAAAQQMSEQMFGRNPAHAVLAQKPELAAALRKAGEESRRMEGLAVQTTTYLVGVPPGMSFDRESVLAPQAGGVAQAARGALGRALRGRRQEAQAEPTDPKQGVIMKMVTEVRDVKSTTVPASLFEIPDGYREIPFPHLDR